MLLTMLQNICLAQETSDSDFLNERTLLVKAKNILRRMSWAKGFMRWDWDRVWVRSVSTRVELRGCSILTYAAREFTALSNFRDGRVS